MKKTSGDIYLYIIPGKLQDHTFNGILDIRDGKKERKKERKKEKKKSEKLLQDQEASPQGRLKNVKWPWVGDLCGNFLRYGPYIGCFQACKWTQHPY